MKIVDRQVRVLRTSENSDNPPQPLRNFYDKSAWILLGEPGSGKTTALKKESKESGGVFLSISEFLSPYNKLDAATIKGKTLFLDALDEARNIDGKLLYDLCLHMKSLNAPKFRLSCRAADWFGISDIEKIKAASVDQQLIVLQLEPLSDQNILEILQENHNIINPEEFVKQAKKHGVESLLKNPQLFNLMIKSATDECPDSRQKIFEQACKHLVKEENKAYRDQERVKNIPRIDNERLFDAAGYLSAGILFSGKIGIALDKNSIDKEDRFFPALEEFHSPDIEAAKRVISSPLFIPSTSGEERLELEHRTTAEYLAGRWLGKMVTEKDLLLKRGLNLILGTDDKAISNLRGLYGWLALHCHNDNRSRLITIDPLTVLIYSDVKSMMPADKRKIFNSLKNEKNRLVDAFFLHGASEVTDVANAFGVLADANLIKDFKEVLTAPVCSREDEYLVFWLLEALLNGQPVPDLTKEVKTLIFDDSCRDMVRKKALQVWLKLNSSNRDALLLLDSITKWEISDNEDRLAELLLENLYPKYIEPQNLLGYLHPPKTKNYIGSHPIFWRDLDKVVPDKDLPILLEQLCKRTDLSFVGYNSLYFLKEMAQSLVIKGVSLYGEKISDEQLFRWLKVAYDERYRQPKPEEQPLIEWLNDHPERYKGLRALCIENNYHLDILKHARSPNDLGLWHLNQASQTQDDNLTRDHLRYALNSLLNHLGCEGLSLEEIIKWGEINPKRKHLLEPLLTSPISEPLPRNISFKKKHEVDKHNRSIDLKKNIDSIRIGNANVTLLWELAAVWRGGYINIPGKDREERFKNYCENDEEIKDAIRQGFPLLLKRDKLPQVEEIIDSNIKQKEFTIGKPYLLGMELFWQKHRESSLNTLTDENLSRAIAWQLTSIDETPEWFKYLVKNKPELVAKVFIKYANATLKSKEGADSYIHIHFHLLAENLDYRELAKIVVPELLKNFPLRIKSNQLLCLKYLLEAVLCHFPAAIKLQKIVEERVNKKSVDIAQKIYLLTAAMLFAPQKYQDKLKKYVGNSYHRIKFLSGFFDAISAMHTLNFNDKLTPKMLGWLIELLMPHAELSWPNGVVKVDENRQFGINIKSMVNLLGNHADLEKAKEEIDRLINLSSMQKLKSTLEAAHYQLRSRYDEKKLASHTLANVVKILTNSVPINAKDLITLVLDCLDEIAQKTKESNVDLFRQFWNENKEGREPKLENSCRDALLNELISRLNKFKVDCQPESDRRGDKRADIRLSYNNFEVLIECKKDTSKKLRESLHKQLIAEYTKSQGYGIYVVFWFDSGKSVTVGDGGKKAEYPQELQKRLEATLQPEEQKHIFVRVLDVSWPK